MERQRDRVRNSDSDEKTQKIDRDIAHINKIEIYRDRETERQGNGDKEIYKRERAIERLRNGETESREIE